MDGTLGALWKGDAKWATIAFGAYLVGVLIIGTVGLSGQAFTLSLILAGLVGVSGSAIGVNSSRKFGGRRNFVGKLMLLFSVSIFSSSLVWFYGFTVFYTVPNFFIQTPPFASFFLILSVIIATYALITSAQAVVDRLNSSILIRLVLALVLVVIAELLSIRGSVIQGLTVFQALESDIVYDLVFFLLIAGALVLINQLGKWYATPGIRVVAYGYVVLGIVPSILRGFLLVSGIDYHLQVIIWITVFTCLTYSISLGLSRTRPRGLVEATPSSS